MYQKREDTTTTGNWTLLRDIEAVCSIFLLTNYNNGLFSMSGYLKYGHLCAVKAG